MKLLFVRVWTNGTWMYVEISIVMLCDTATVCNWLQTYRNNAVLPKSRQTITEGCSTMSHQNEFLSYTTAKAYKALVYIYIYTRVCVYTHTRIYIYMYIYTHARAHTHTHTHTQRTHMWIMWWYVRLSTRVTVTSVECILTYDKHQMPRSLYSWVILFCLQLTSHFTCQPRENSSRRVTRPSKCNNTYCKADCTTLSV